MPRPLFASLVLGLSMTAGIIAPSFAADNPPPPPIDWSDLVGGPDDSVVGEEMC